MQSNTEARLRIFVVSACVWVPGRFGVCLRMCACIFAYPACNAYEPCCAICGFCVEVLTEDNVLLKKVFTAYGLT
jgi:hypothetical protein